jgi:outer membrane protein
MNLKKIKFAFALLLCGHFAIAQKIAVIDTKFILSKLPDYTEAQTKLESIASEWQKEIEEKRAKLDQKHRDFELEKALLSDELIQKRKEDIEAGELELRLLQNKRFGVDGDLFKKQREFVKPIQDRVYNAVQRMAKNGAYDIVLDKSEGITIIFADPKLDRNETVLRELGVK